MKIPDFIAKYISKVKIGKSEVVVLDIPPEIYYKELAIYTARSYISNAFSLCEIKVYENWKSVRNMDYYLLNVAANRNENSSYFWHKVIKKMIENPEGALVVEIKGELHCAESFNIREERPIAGNLYDGIVLEGGLQINKVFNAEEVYLFRMEDESVKRLIEGLYKDYGKFMKAAARAFIDTNGRKFKFKVDAIKAGDTEFEEDFKNVITKNIKAYMENEYATYVEYEGEELEEQSGNKQPKGAEDIINIRKDIFDMAGQAFKIPNAMMSGNITNLKDVCDIFLTFSLDPFAATITKVLNKRATFEQFAKGNYYKCYTGKVKHRDLFDSAVDADKLIASSVMCTDEVREELDKEPLNTEWSKRHYITKNYNEVSKATKLLEGGENNE